MKKLVVLLVAVVLVAMTAVQVWGLMLTPPEEFNRSFSLWLIDYYNQDNKLLITYGGEPGGYGALDWPVYRIHTLENGRLRTFRATDVSVPMPSFLSYGGQPQMYRNRETEELKWLLFFDGFEGWFEYTVHEIRFDFDTFEYFIAELGTGRDEYRRWNDEWELVVPADLLMHFGSGRLTQRRLLRILQSEAYVPVQPWQTWLWIAVPTGIIIVLAASTTTLLIIRKRRNRNAPES